MRLLIALFLCCALSATAQSTKTDKKLMRQFQQDVGYLASDALEGRATGSRGETLAADFLIKRYQQLGIPAFGEKYRLPFSFTYGRQIDSASFVRINGRKWTATDGIFPLPFSASAKVTGDPVPEAMEQDNIWVLPLYDSQDEAADPHFDWEKAIYERSQNAHKQGATAVLFFDGFGSKYPPRFNALSLYDPLDIPVLFITHQALGQGLDLQGALDIALDVHIRKTERHGANVAAFINNQAPYTVVLGAHYDHLGLGEDGSSLSAAKNPEIHNGADDNASGTAALLALAAKIKKAKLKNYNYLFVHFSGEELGLLGSKAFVKEFQLDSNKLAYMVNLDMVGRLSDSSRALTLGGVGTSPAWAPVVSRAKESFKVGIDSSGIGPSDHTSFYNTGVPVLFFFTGIHHDYHKPSDDADKINYAGMAQITDFIFETLMALDAQPKPGFTPTKQPQMASVRFKVTLGVLPDYSYTNGDGLRIDGVTEGRPAQKAGLQAGDVITAIGPHEVKGIQSYMEALSKLKAGEKTTVNILRDGQKMTLPVTL